MTVDAALPKLLRLQRKRKLRTGGQSSANLSTGNQSQMFTTGLTMTTMDGTAGAVTEVHRHHSLDKERLVERLVLEDVMSRIFFRCMLFGVLFIMLISLMWQAFPASEFRSVHESIITGYDIRDSFESIATIGDVQAYLKSAVAMSHAFSPGSSEYLEDVQSKYFLPSPQLLPPVVDLGSETFPMLSQYFTITVWIRTKVRFDTIIKKTAGGKTCWQWGLESIVYGAHDAFFPERAVHPWAASIYKVGVDAVDEWSKSNIKTKLSDDKWHNVAIIVSPEQVIFLSDGYEITNNAGAAIGKVKLLRPIEDCPNGVVSIGSASHRAEMSDLVFFPRALGENEYTEMIKAGRPVDVTLSGSGPVASSGEQTFGQQLSQLEADGEEGRQETQEKLTLSQQRSAMEAVGSLSRTEKSIVGVGVGCVGGSLTVICIEGYTCQKANDSPCTASDTGCTCKRPLCSPVDGSSATTTRSMCRCGTVAECNTGDICNASSASGSGECIEPVQESLVCRVSTTVYKCVKDFQCLDESDALCLTTTTTSCTCKRPVCDPVDGSKRSTTRDTFPQCRCGPTKLCDVTQMCTSAAAAGLECNVARKLLVKVTMTGVNLNTVAEKTKAETSLATVLSTVAGATVEQFNVESVTNYAGNFFMFRLNDLTNDELTSLLAVPSSSFSTLQASMQTELQGGTNPIPAATVTAFAIRTDLYYDGARTCGGTPEPSDCRTGIVKSALQLAQNDLVAQKSRGSLEISQELTLRTITCLLDPSTIASDLRPVTWVKMDVAGNHAILNTCITNVLNVINASQLGLDVTELRRQITAVLVFRVRDRILFVENEKCVHSKHYRSLCKATCGLSCSGGSTSLVPSQFVSTAALTKCMDRGDYLDYMGQSCSWYKLNDPTCTFANIATKEACKLTCGRCVLEQVGTQQQQEVLKDPLLTIEELNERSLKAKRTDLLIPRSSSYLWVAYYCCIGSSYGVRGSTNNAHWFKLLNYAVETCDHIYPPNAAGTYRLGVTDEFRRAFQSDYPECFPNILGDTDEPEEPVSMGIPGAYFLDKENAVEQTFSASPDAGREVPRTIPLKIRQAAHGASTHDARVRIFAKRASGQGVPIDVFSLASEERTSWQWTPCSDHATCQGRPDAFACGPEHYSDGDCVTIQNTGLVVQKQFCSKVCYTGGCVLPTSASALGFCQPCDMCNTTSIVGAFACANICPNNDDTAKDRSAITTLGTALRTYENAILQVQRNDDAPGAFSISMWVRDFQYQNVLEKNVVADLGSASHAAEWEGYNVATKQLLCYKLTYASLCYRTHWYDKKMTCVANPMYNELLDEKWHHFAVVKKVAESYPTKYKLPWSSVNIASAVKQRSQELIFYVDGKPTSTKLVSGTDVENPVTPWGLMDCGGPMVTTREVSSAGGERVEGIQLLFLNALVSKVASGVRVDDVIPLGGSSTSTVFRFDDLGIPRGATITHAVMELCASQGPVSRALMERGCGTRVDETAVVNVKTVIVAPNTESCTTSVTKAHCDARQECDWDASKTEKQCQESSTHYCRTSYSLKNDAAAGRAPQKMQHWTLNRDEWQKTPIMPVSNGTHNAEPESASRAGGYDSAMRESCRSESPDIAAVIQEFIERPSYAQGDAITLAIVPDHADRGYDNDYVVDRCSYYSNAELDLFNSGIAGNCDALHLLAKNIAAYYPLFATTRASVARNPNGFAPRLRVSWCDRADCLSSVFAGAGDDVLWGRTGIRAATVPTASTQKRNSTGSTYPPEPKFGHASDSSIVDKFNLTVGSSAQADSKPVSQGVIFDLRTIPRAIVAHEMQKMYYRDIHLIPTLAGPSERVTSSSRSSQVDIVTYTKEIVSIIPPMLFQTRSPLIPCAQFLPGLGQDMENYFNAQTNKKCSKVSGEHGASARNGPDGPYTCAAQDENATHGFFCVDREGSLPPETTHFGRTPVLLTTDETNEFPEFLEIMEMDSVYREGSVMETKNWVDVQTASVTLLNVFLAPGSRMGIVLRLIFDTGGAGNVETEFRLASFKQMNAKEQTGWVILAAFIIIFCVLEILLVAASWMRRAEDRKRWINMAHSSAADAADIIRDNALAHEVDHLLKKHKMDLQKRLKSIAKSVPIFAFLDIFDIALRVAICVFTIVNILSYFTSDLYGDGSNLGVAEKRMSEILRLPWWDENVTYTAKVEQFNKLIASTLADANSSLTLRIIGVVVVLICLGRLIVYMRVHPRVALLYKTIMTSLADLFHFSITFVLLYIVFAFIATWTFGALDERYESFSETMYSQFNMVIGEFPLDPVPELQSLYVAYLIAFCVLMFFILMNFFLAIIIDSYAEMKEQVDECVVSTDFVSDLMLTFGYYWYRWRHSWPPRSELVASLIQADLNHDKVNDIQQVVTVVPGVLVSEEIFPTIEGATLFVEHYSNIRETMRVHRINPNRSASKPSLEHQIALKHLMRLDLVSTYCQSGLHIESHPLANRREEAQSLVKTFIKMTHKILVALRVNRADFCAITQKDADNDSLDAASMRQPQGGDPVQRSLAHASTNVDLGTSLLFQEKSQQKLAPHQQRTAPMESTASLSSVLFRGSSQLHPAAPAQIQQLPKRPKKKRPKVLTKRPAEEPLDSGVDEEASSDIVKMKEEEQPSDAQAEDYAVSEDDERSGPLTTAI